VDYTKEINAFFDWLETNTLTDSAIVLWHALMHTCNRAGWPDEFAVAISTLSNKTGLKKDAINRARHRLQQTGRIDFQSRAGQQSAIYKILPFHVEAQKTSQSKQNIDCDVINDTKRDANRAQSDAQSATQTASINKDLNTSSSSSSGQGETYESYYTAHKRVFGFECNPHQSQQLGVYIDQDGMEEKVVIRAIERAGAASTGYNFKFIARILDDYFKSGVKTLQQAVVIDDAFDARKNRSTDNKKTDKAEYFAEQARREQELEQVRSLETV
jgi:DnaD/phage-associated family protein